MTFDEYQVMSMRTANDHADLITAALGLAGEGGEFADQIKKWYGQGHDLDQAHLMEELGDALWYIALAAERLGVSLHEIAYQNTEKLRRRYPNGFDPERSRNR